MEINNKTNGFVRLAKHPFGVYLAWLIALTPVSIIAIPLLSMGYADGEQRPLILLGYALDILFAGLILISLLSPILHWTWYKKYNYVPLIVPFLIAGILIYWIVQIYLSNDHHFAL